MRLNQEQSSRWNWSSCPQTETRIGLGPHPSDRSRRGHRRENLSRVQLPYFTTKNRGDEDRGFGLGLAICRKIVTLHGGHISIDSQLRKGTTVQVDLPSRQ